MTGGRDGAAPGSGLRALYRKMTPRRRRHLLVLAVAMLAAAAAEMAAIGAVLPFVAALAGTTAALPAWAAPGPRFGADPLLAASALLIAAAAAAAAMRLALLRLSHTFAAGLAHEIGSTIFARMLRQPYAAYLKRNSSDILSGIEKIQTLVAGVLLPLVQAVTGLAIAAGIAAMLLLISPFGTAVGAGFVAAAYVLVSFAVRGRLERNSDALARLSRARIKEVQEALGGIRDILIERSQGQFEQRFRALDGQFRRAQAANLFIAAAPRYLIEAAGIGAVALIALAMSAGPGGLGAALPALGALALGAQRLLPLLQQAYFGWSQTAGNRHALADVVALMDMPTSEEAVAAGEGGFAFERDIVLDGVSFEYGGGGPALHRLSLRIPRGARIGIVGRTGSGKSTLLDLLMGLLDPDSGEIRIDGRRLDRSTKAAWQARIAHVPQSVYLADASIAANIAFGRAPGRVDMERVREAARLAQLDGFVAAQPEGFETPVGERGVRLSGGERQRIGLARALYKRAELLILDEATSALDDQTEAAAMAAIDGLGDRVTIVMIAHRASTLARCGRVVRLEGGRIAGDGAAAAPRAAAR